MQKKFVWHALTSMACVITFFPASALAFLGDTYEEFMEEVRRCVFSCNYEIAGLFMRAEEAQWEVVVIDTSLDETSVSVPIPDSFFDGVRKEDDVLYIHTHPLSAFGSSLLDGVGGSLSLQERGKVCSGKRIPPAGQPSMPDLLTAIGKLQKHPPAQFVHKVYDPSGVWTYYVADSSHPFIRGIRKAWKELEVVLRDAKTEEEKIDAEIVFGQFVTELPGYDAFEDIASGPRPLSPDRSVRDARIRELLEIAPKAGLFLSYTPNEYSAGGRTIPDCVATEIQDADSGGGYANAIVETDMARFASLLIDPAQSEWSIDLEFAWAEKGKQFIADAVSWVRDFFADTVQDVFQRALAWLKHFFASLVSWFPHVLSSVWSWIVDTVTPDLLRFNTTAMMHGEEWV